MAYVIGDDCIACGTCQAQSVVLVHLFVLLRQSACPNYVWYVIKAIIKAPIQEPLFITHIFCIFAIKTI